MGRIRLIPKAQLCRNCKRGWLRVHWKPKTRRPGRVRLLRRLKCDCCGVIEKKWITYFGVVES